MNRMSRAATAFLLVATLFACASRPPASPSMVHRANYEGVIHGARPVDTVDAETTHDTAMFSFPNIKLADALCAGQGVSFTPSPGHTHLAVGESMTEIGESEHLAVEPRDAVVDEGRQMNDVSYEAYTDDGHVGYVCGRDLVRIAKWSGVLVTPAPIEAECGFSPPPSPQGITSVGGVAVAPRYVGTAAQCAAFRKMLEDVRKQPAVLTATRGLRLTSADVRMNVIMPPGTRWVLVNDVNTEAPSKAFAMLMCTKRDRTDCSALSGSMMVGDAHAVYNRLIFAWSSLLVPPGSCKIRLEAISAQPVTEGSTLEQIVRAHCGEPPTSAGTEKSGR